MFKIQEMILNMNDYSRVNYIDVIEPCKRTVSVEYFRYILSKIKNDCGF